MNNKKSFGYILQQKPRRIVIHHTHLISNIMDYLEDGDIVFFDDCLYSQYVFINEHINELKDKNITCVLGFSGALYRSNDTEGIYDIRSDVIHNDIIDWYKNQKSWREVPDSIRGFMTINEIKELLEYPNIYLAGHGFYHIHIKDKIFDDDNYYENFISEVELCLKVLRELDLKTNIWVYPFTENLGVLSDGVLMTKGFIHIFGKEGSYRASIEDLVNGNRSLEHS